MRKMMTIRIRDYNCLKFRISKSLKIDALTEDQLRMRIAHTVASAVGITGN